MTASTDKTAQIWDAVSGKRLGKPLRHQGNVLTAIFDSKGDRIVTASSDKTARWIGKDAEKELTDARQLERLAAAKA